MRRHYSEFRPEKLDKINAGMTRLDAILGKLDHQLADALTRVHGAGDEAARTAERRNVEAILTDYRAYVEGEPLIDLVDRNPFGVATNLKRVLREALTHMADAIS